MTTFNIREYRESDRDAVVALWRECGLVRPWNDPVKDIHRKLRPEWPAGGDGNGWIRGPSRLDQLPGGRLQIRRSNTEAIGFYRSLGFAEDNSISMGKRLIED